MFSISIGIILYQGIGIHQIGIGKTSGIDKKSVRIFWYSSGIGIKLYFSISICIGMKVHTIISIIICIQLHPVISISILVSVEPQPAAINKFI